MGPKTILVCLTTLEHADTLMKAAVPLARRHGAHLIGLHTIEALLVYPGIAVHVPDTAFSTFNENQKKESNAIKAIFDRHTEKEVFASEYRLVRSDDRSASSRIVESARAADLVIMSHKDTDAERFDQRGTQNEVIRSSGRPVIVVPLGYDGPPIGDNILLGWSDTREAARAAHDVLNVADERADLTVLRVGRNWTDTLHDHTGVDLVEMFARHGLKPTLAHREIGEGTVSDILIKMAFEQGADLIVTGAFGHSRAYDFVIGATTYALLRDAKVPVMFSK